MTDNDYLSPTASQKTEVKIEKSPEPYSFDSTQPSTSATQTSSPRSGTKRPRRSATRVVKTYAEISSSDEAMDEGAVPIQKTESSKPNVTQSKLSLWVLHLTALVKEEQKKVRLSADY